MSDYRKGLHRLPEHMRESSSFMRAVLTNDLMGAFAHADETNAACMKGWVLFLYNHAPSECYGSLEKLNAWHERSGLLGRRYPPDGDT